MITKENGLKYAKLVHVSVDNGQTEQSNKVYIMEEQDDGRIKCDYGRGGKNMATVYKPAHQWNKIYKQKTSPKKNYTDVTEMIAESLVEEPEINSHNNKIATIPDKLVRKLIDDLMAFANKFIKKNYKVTQDAVTQKQVDTAQEMLDDIIKLIKIDCDIEEINNKLLKLYTIIPRRMDNVKNHLLKPINNKNDLEKTQHFLSNEQDTLDTMAGQVTLIKQQKDSKLSPENKDEKIAESNILDQMGLKIEVETNTESLKLINKLLGSNASRAKNIFKVINIKTQERFNKHLKKTKNKRRRLYWHGSRNENWFNIIQTGLLIRPSGSIHTGSMFGDGIYFADKSQKSLGYSSLRGSYWTGGASNKGYMALFDVHLGKQKEILHHSFDYYNLSQKILDKDGYDSVFAKGGADLRNNEYVIYDPAKCTIAYIIEIE